MADMSDYNYTPSTDEVREVWCDWNTVRESVPSEEAWAEHGAAFDRWLAERDRRVAERAWQEGYEAGSSAVQEDAEASS